MPSKANLRAAALAARDAMSETQRAAAAQAVAERGLPIEISARHDRLRLFTDPQRDRSDAPDARLAAQGARLALPAVTPRGQSLIFRAWSPHDRMQLGPLGIPEPSPAAAEIIPDVMLVPLAAFDQFGHRIGYGAGHYDRSLAHLRKSKAITP